MKLRRSAGAVLLAAALVIFVGRAQAQQAKPLSEEALSTLVDQQIPDDVIIRRIEKNGVGFSVDAAALERLKKAGASAPVLAALQQAGQPANAVTYQGVLKMLREGTDEGAILKLLEASPTTFTLDDEQVAALKKAGAGDRLLRAMQSSRSPGSAASDISDFAVVLDCSGSMNDKTPDGVSKMDAAKKVVTKFIRGLPNGKGLAFIVYGTEPTKYKCEDVHVVQPLAPLTDEMKDRLEKYIAGLEPAGWTPLALGMQTAGKELAKGKGLCQLIVVTDGMETCNGKPGDVADDLVKSLNLPGGVDVIGFGVEPDEKAALYALEKKGKLNLYKADTGGDELVEKIRAAQERAERDAKAAAEAAATKMAAEEAAAKKAAEEAAEAAAARKAAQDAAAKKAAEEAASRKEEFPGGESITWEVGQLEDAEKDFTLVKRRVKPDSVIWIIQPQSTDAVEKLDLVGSYNNKGAWTARFFDEDGVEIKRTPLTQSPASHDVPPGSPPNPNFRSIAKRAGIQKGDKVSLTLPLPEEVMKKTKKVIVDWR